jgi:outer membrane protein assembly factor BamB
VGSPDASPGDPEDRSRAEEQRNLYLVAGAVVIGVVVLLALVVVPRLNQSDTVGTATPRSSTSFAPPGSTSSTTTVASTTTERTSVGRRGITTTTDEPVDPDEPTTSTVPEVGAFRGANGMVFASDGNLVGFTESGRITSIANDGEQTIVWQSKPCRRADWAEVVPIEHEGAFLVYCDDRIAALDITTGDFRWVTPIDIPAVDWLRAGDGVFAVVMGDELIVSDLATGEERWRIELLPTDFHALGVDATSIYVSDGTELLSFALDGTPHWRVDVDTAWVQPTPVGLFVRGDDHAVHRLDAATGAVVWSSEVDQARLWNGTVLGANEHQVVMQGNWFRNLLAFDTQTGALLWARDDGIEEQMVATMTGERVAFARAPNRFELLDAATGRTLLTEPAFVARPSFAGGQVSFIDETRHLAVRAVP